MEYTETILEASDKLNNITNYLKIIDNSFFDYIENRFKDDPEIPIYIVDEFIKKSNTEIEEIKNIINGMKTVEA